MSVGSSCTSVPSREFSPHDGMAAYRRPIRVSSLEGCEDDTVHLMNDAQIWTMIGSFIALMLSMMTVVSTLFIRVVRTEIGGLRNEMNAQIGGLRGEMNARFDTVNTRIDGLDRDMQAVVKRTFGLDRD